MFDIVWRIIAFFEKKKLYKIIWENMIIQTQNSIEKSPKHNFILATVFIMAQMIVNGGKAFRHSQRLISKKLPAYFLKKYRNWVKYTISMVQHSSEHSLFYAVQVLLIRKVKELKSEK